MLVNTLYRVGCIKALWSWYLFAIELRVHMLLCLSSLHINHLQGNRIFSLLTIELLSLESAPGILIFGFECLVEVVTYG